RGLTRSLGICLLPVSLHFVLQQSICPSLRFGGRGPPDAESVSPFALYFHGAGPDRVPDDFQQPTFSVRVADRGEFSLKVVPLEPHNETIGVKLLMLAIERSQVWRAFWVRKAGLVVRCA